MFVPKEIENRKIAILMSGIPVVEIKVSKVDQDEIVGSYSDGEEIHIMHKAIKAWWLTRFKPGSKKKKAKAKENGEDKESMRGSNSHDLAEDGTITQEEEESTESEALDGLQMDAEEKEI